MAHTDRDTARWMRCNHNNEPCIFDDIRALPWSLRRRIPVNAIHCEICDTLWSGENRPRYYTSTRGKSAWNRDERQVERGKARAAIRRCLNGHDDWDNLSIRYRRPYWD